MIQDPCRRNPAREWLDNWSAIGLIIAGMTHPGSDVQLTRVLWPRLARELLPSRHRPLHRWRLAWEPTPWQGGAAGGGV